MTYNQRAANCNRQLSMETSVNGGFTLKRPYRAGTKRLAAADERGRQSIFEAQREKRIRYNFFLRGDLETPATGDCRHNQH
jgi:hypothetical protein